MISKKEQIKKYILFDLRCKKMPNILKLWLRGDENYATISFIIALRHYEYYYNNPKTGLTNLIMKYIWRQIYIHKRDKYNIFINVNSTRCGLHLMHSGFRRLGSVTSIGENCTILPNVLIGKKKPNTNCKAIIGNNCYISTGVTILAPVKIGNNVTIGAGAVVTKDIPDNAIVGGIPAKILKLKEKTTENE